MLIGRLVDSVGISQIAILLQDTFHFCRDGSLVTIPALLSHAKKPFNDDRNAFADDAFRGAPAAVVRAVGDVRKRARSSSVTSSRSPV